MPDYDNTNKGVLFRNEKKENKSHSDHQGSINIEGVEYWLNAWIKESKSGKKFFSLSVKRKEPKTQEEQPNLAKKEKDIDDEIPF